LRVWKASEEFDDWSIFIFLAVVVILRSIEACGKIIIAS